jgi:hypothetical protein
MATSEARRAKEMSQKMTRKMSRERMAQYW